MDNDSNVIQFHAKSDIRRRMLSGYEKVRKGEATWIEGSIESAVALCDGRTIFPNDNNSFSYWLVDEGLNFHSKDDQAALINMGADPVVMRSVLEETDSRSYRLIWSNNKNRWGVRSVATTPSEPTSIVEMAIAATAARPVSEPTFAKPEIRKPVETPAETYEVPKVSKLRDILGPAADVLHARFKHDRIFNAAFKNEKLPTARWFANYLADRCQQPDYPQALFLNQAWSLEMIYPHLPLRLLNQLPQKLGTLKNDHVLLTEVERLFKLSPEFGVTDPPMVAFNKAMSIYNGLKHRKAGATVDPGAMHKPSYGDDEGKPPVVVRGTKLWPAETTAGYCYDDLRCACGFASDVMNTFDDTRNASLSSRTLKLRHLMSWVDGGYNSTGSTTNGMLKAMRSVIDAYSKNVSEEMRAPLPSMIKNDSQ